MSKRSQGADLQGLRGHLKMLAVISRVTTGLWKVLSRGVTS